jgi:DNA-directed RNA polymerase subunit RPC12/RpoP
VIKFRCQRCAQKIAVEDEGSGAVIDCPTCHESMIVPPGTDREFLRPARRAAALELSGEPAPSARAAWSRLIIEKLVPALLSQRRHLLETQDAATEQLAALEQRVILMRMKFQRRLEYYRERVAALESENRELSQRVNGSRDDGAAEVRAFGVGRIDLSRARFLMRL